MRKILLRLILFFIIVLLPLQLFLYFCPMTYHYSDYVMWKNTWENTKENNFQAIIIGDSRAKAGIFPLDLTDDVYSLTLGGSTPVEGYYTLKEYLKNNENLEYVIISYAPFDLQDHGWLWHRTIKYDFLESQSIFEIFKEYEKAGKGSKKDYLKYWLYKLKYPRLFLNEMTDSFKDLTKKRKKNYDILAMLDYSKGYHWFATAEYSDELNNETNYDSFFVTDVINSYMNKMLSLCHEENIPVYYVTMPMNKASFYGLAKQYISDYDEYLNSLEEKYPNLDIFFDINYKSNKQFADSSHMNEQGAHIFTKQLDDILITSEKPRR